MKAYNFLFCCFMLLGLLFSKPKSFEKFICGVSFTILMYKIRIYCLLKARLGVLKIHHSVSRNLPKSS